MLDVGGKFWIGDQLCDASRARLDPISHSLSDHRSLRTLLHGGNARELGEQDGEHDIESARN